MNKTYYILELDKVIELLKKKVVLNKNLENLNTIVLEDNLEKIDYALSETLEATKIMQRLGRFPMFFKSDISLYLKKVSKSGILTELEVLEIGKFLDTIRDTFLFLEELKNYDIEHLYFSHSLNKLEYLKDLNLQIKSIITPYGEMKDDASSELNRLRKAIKNMENNIQKKLQEILQKNSNKLSQNIVSIRNDRYVIPVKNDYKNTIKGIIHDQSASGETVFVEPQVILELNNTLNNTKEDEKREIIRILKEISSLINENYDSLLHSYNTLLHMDLVFAKAILAIEMDANKPIVNDKGIVDLVNCRHPLLKVDKVVANNISLGKDYQGIIITGPNTGGKTVLLKTLGLLALMTKFGLLIPCDENSQMMIFDNVYADIGDEQSIDQNLSTFSAHMTNIINIINNVSDNSLVLLDELGSGTDPAEGSSLAIAIIDYLLEKNCLIVTTSHYSELKVYGFNSDKVINASVEFDINTLKPTYKLLIGVPGQSHALNISRILGLKPEIIKRAEGYSFEKDNNLDKVLDKLINQTYEFDEKLKISTQKIKEYNDLITQLDSEIAATIKERNKILSDAQIKADEMILKSLKEAEDLVKQLQEMQLKEVKLHEITEAKFKIKQIKKTNLLPEVELTDDNFEINEHVFVQNYHNYGIILKENKNDLFDVQIGNATVKVHKKHLKKTKKKRTTPKAPRSTSKVLVNKSVGMKLDLRGKRYEEARILLEKYLDDCLLAGLSQVIIIHGYGTGAIRNMVQEFLRQNKFIESYRYGDANEGGFGATVVNIKK